MEALQVLEERVHFGRDIPANVNSLLQQAVAEARDFDRARALMYEAMRLSPFQLEVYIALYKFCFYRGHIDEAEQVATNALRMAADKGGFEYDWQTLDINSTDWNEQDGPARVYLYSLKALAFINLRQDRLAHAERILQKLAELDPQDQAGASVIRSLLEGL